MVIFYEFLPLKSTTKTATHMQTFAIGAAASMSAERVDSQNLGIHMVERSPKIPIGARPPDARRQPRRGTTHCVFVVRLKFK